MSNPESPTQPQITFVRSALAPTIYVEGLSQMMVGFPNSRILLHNWVERDPNNPSAPEVRQVACELVMPTSTLIEIAQNILTSMAMNRPLLVTAQNEWLGKLNALNDSLQGDKTAAIQSDQPD